MIDNNQQKINFGDFSAIFLLAIISKNRLHSFSENTELHSFTENTES